MRIFLKGAALVLIGPLMIIIIVLAVLVIFMVNFDSGPNLRDHSYIKGASAEFLITSSRSLFPGDTYTLVELKGPAGPEKDWILLTIARYNPSWAPGTGAGGLIAIGRLERSGWRFQLPTGREFDSWLIQLPEVLLSKKLKTSFQTSTSYPKEFSSVLPPRISSQSSYQDIELYLPYPEKRRYKITTLPGDGGHLKKWNAYEAIDFDMPRGADVAASAGGEIIALRDNSPRGGCNEKYKDDANYVVIKIAPNQTIRYMHLEYQSVTKSGIKLHDKVETGKIIGKADTSGWACGAHLHVVREKLCGNQVCGSLPLNFEEFKTGDPKYGGEGYQSDNKSPEDRRKEQAEREIEEIKQVAARYASIWACGVSGDCDLKSHPDRALATDNLVEQMQERVKKIGGGAQKAVPLEWEVLSVELEDEGTAKVEGRVSGDVVLANGNQQYEFLHIFIKLVKESGKWKIESRESDCGFVNDPQGRRKTIAGLTFCEY